MTKLVMTINLGEDFEKPENFDIVTFMCDFMEWDDGTVTQGKECIEVGTWDIIYG